MAVSCSPREDRPQIQVWGAQDAGAGGTIYWTGVRTHSAEQEFLTHGDVSLSQDLGGLESRWAPAGGWAGESMQLEYRAGAKVVSVSLYLMADDRGNGSCTAAGTAIVAG